MNEVIEQVASLIEGEDDRIKLRFMSQALEELQRAVESKILGLMRETIGKSTPWEAKMASHIEQAQREAVGAE